MATLSDIDTKASVGKFLTRQIVSPKEDETADSADEVEALLESVAISLLLFPQAALVVLLRAKNTLQQVVTGEIEVVDYLRSTLRDVTNPDLKISDLSDLVEAQTALVELDRLGRIGDVQPFTRYNAAINRFLDTKLAKSLKRHARGEFERSGSEARQDIFQTLSTFPTVHRVLLDYLRDVLGGVDDFNGVDLTQVVSRRTIARVRSSVRQVKTAMEQQTLSHTVAAIELLSGSASLESVSRTRGVYDPAVDTGRLPQGRTITVDAEPVSAFAQTAPEQLDISADTTPWMLNTEIHHGSFTASQNIELPGPGGSGGPYLLAAQIPATVTVPVGGTLYLRITVSGVPSDVSIPLPAGVQPFATIQATLEAGMQAFDVGSHCVELFPGNRRLLLTGPGTFDSMVVTPSTSLGLPGPSVAELLGFRTFQASKPTGVFSAAELLDILGSTIAASGSAIEGEVAVSVTEDGRVRLSATATDADNRITFLAAPPSLGLASAEAEPTYLVLKEDGQELAPADVGVYVGSLVVTADSLPSPRSLSAPVAVIEGNRLRFAPGPLPRCRGASTTITAIIVREAQQLLTVLRPFAGRFDQSVGRIQRSLTPILSANPTQAQIADADRALGDLRDLLADLLMALQSVVVRPDRSQYEATAESILTGLEERGLDRALDLLRRARFSEFFGLTKEVAAKGARFLHAIEEVGRQDVPGPTVETELPEGNLPKGDNPDADVLPEKEPSE